MGWLRSSAFVVARTPAAGALVRFGFAHLDRLLPLSVIARDRHCAVYAHPAPSYGTRHRIAVPLVGVPDVLALAHPRHAELRTKLFALIARAVRIDGLPTSVLVNAGPRQDVGQVHFHLTDDPLAEFPVGQPCWTDWEAAVCGLSSVAGLDQRYRAGFSLLRRASGPGVELV